MTIAQFREKINSVTTVQDLVDILYLYNVYAAKTSGSIYSYATCRVKGYIIGWDKEATTIYVTKGGELILFGSNPLDKDFVNYVLDRILNLDSSDAFYQLYFRAYGYNVPDNVSDEVKDAFKYFKDRRADIEAIYVGNNYHSVSLIGKRIHTNTDIEYRIVSCTKEEILDIVEITHIQPVINKPNNLEFYDKPCMNRPLVSDKDIMDSYNEYKDSLAYE